MKNSRTIKLFTCFMCIICITTNCLGVSYIYNVNNNKKVDESSISSKDVIAKPEFNFTSNAQILMDPYSKTVLYENNADEHLLPASVTKVMTLLLLMEKIDNGSISYSDKVTCSDNASKMGGSQIWFKPGEELTIDECLKAICVVSANDVTAKFWQEIKY